MEIINTIEKTSSRISKEKVTKLITGLIKDKSYRNALYVIMSFSTGMRVSDLLDWKWEYIVNGEDFKNEFNVRESKTGKGRRIIFSKSVLEVMELLWRSIDCPKEGYIFVNKNNERLTVRGVNYILKDINVSYLGKGRIDHFSSHSLRKGFAYNYWLSNNKSDAALVMLQQILNHSSISMTLIYLGFTEKEKDKAYNTKFDLVF